jgi:SAM-dependent methyltransferase
MASDVADRAGVPMPWPELNEWFQSPLGQRFIAHEANILGRTIPDLFGFHLIQVGRASGLDLSRWCRTRYCHLLDLCPQPGAGSLCRAEPEHLPIRSDSVDVLVLLHVLDFCQEPHEALREADRVLVPEGHLVLCGFNALSVWGLRMLLHRRRLPWSARMLSVGRLRDWLALLGFDTLRTDFFCHTPPLTHPGVLRHLQRFDVPGARRLPLLGGGYVLLARKRVSTLIPLRPRWLPKRRLAAAGVPEPTPRRSHGDQPG